MKNESVLAEILQELKSESMNSAFATMKSHLTLEPDEHLKIDRYFGYKIDSLAESLQDVCIDGDESELKNLIIDR